MNQLQRAALAALALLLGALCASHAQTPSTSLQLRLEPRTNAIDLVVDGAAAAGAFFIYQAQDLPSLLNSPTVVVQTNTPLTNGLRFALPVPGTLPSQAFFTAAHWPGRTVDEFGTRENYPTTPPPAQLLFTAGVPTNLTSGQSFTVDFFIADSAGELLAVSGEVAVMVLRRSDGRPHPDALVSPPTGQLIDGYLRLTLAVQASTSLEGYTLGLGPTAPSASPLPFTVAASPPSPLDQAIAVAFNFSPTSLDSLPDIRETFVGILATLRALWADPSPDWSVPLAGYGYAISGTYGEWRGKDNREVHLGLDFAVSPLGMILASRGGVVSYSGSLPGAGKYLVLDHGDGCFSRYLHLNPLDSILKTGDPVGRGSFLGTTIQSHEFHFEIRRASAQAHWGDAAPGEAVDPCRC